jgi:predicted nucleic acid-binding protein
MVIDASALVELLLDTEAGMAVAERARWPGEVLHAPHLLDVEVAHAVRRYAASGNLGEEEAVQAIRDLRALPVERHPHGPLLARAWELRHSMTAYDAMYVVLAEALAAPLLTGDAGLARAHGHRATILVAGESRRR